ncbi:MAG TPA: hypothetical protein VHG53_06715 [Candidatus Limnocylindria bacterium]|nr:hypothetical protein [Candidatus Limnocylindria bacterium]
MDHELDDAGEALGAAVAAHSPHRPPPELRERLLREVARRVRPVRWWARRSIIAGAATLVLLLAGPLAWGLSLNAALAQERSLRTQLEDAATRDEVVFEVVDARNVSKTTLRSPTDDSPTAPYGKVFTRPDMPYVVAMSGRLPRAPAGRAYHLYLDARRIGTLTPNDAGFAYFVFRADAVGITYQQARVVIEAPAATDASGATVLAAPQR